MDPYLHPSLSLVENVENGETSTTWGVFLNWAIWSVFSVMAFLILFCLLVLLFLYCCQERIVLNPARFRGKQDRLIKEPGDPNDIGLEYINCWVKTPDG
jgi:hypothetical protein